MKVDAYGQQVYTEQDVCNELMRNPVIEDYGVFLVESVPSIDQLVQEY